MNSHSSIGDGPERVRLGKSKPHPRVDPLEFGISTTVHVAPLNFVGEDASWEVDVDGIFADGDSPFSFEAGDFANCDAIIGCPAWAVKAVIQVKDGESLTEAELRVHCRANLGGFKQPTSFDFVEQIPRNLTGKVLKKDLRAPYWEGHRRDVS